MGIEIERKFLVKNDSWRNMAVRSADIVQGYIDRTPAHVVRVRRMDDACFLTIKGVNYGMSRAEFEYAVPVEDADELLQLCRDDILHKRRHYVPYHGLTWEVDEFFGRREGLVVAEVELLSEDVIVELPPFIGEEVTGRPEYYNSNL